MCLMFAIAFHLFRIPHFASQYSVLVRNNIVQAIRLLLLSCLSASFYERMNHHHWIQIVILFAKVYIAEWGNETHNQTQRYKKAWFGMFAPSDLSYFMFWNWIMYEQTGSDVETHHHSIVPYCVEHIDVTWSSLNIHYNQYGF